MVVGILFRPEQVGQQLWTFTWFSKKAYI